MPDVAPGGAGAVPAVDPGAVFVVVPRGSVGAGAGAVAVPVVDAVAVPVVDAGAVPVVDAGVVLVAEFAMVLLAVDAAAGLL